MKRVEVDLPFLTQALQDAGFRSDERVVVMDVETDELVTRLIRALLDHIDALEARVAGLEEVVREVLNFDTETTELYELPVATVENLTRALHGEKLKP